jgi:hypothetical protein
MVEIHWFPFNVTTPYIREMKILEKNKMVFNGHFYLEDGVFPVYRIIMIGDHKYLIKVLDKKIIKDTSAYGNYDEEIGARISLTPLGIIQLKYKLIKPLKDVDEIKKIEEEIIKREKKIRERSNELYYERIAREWEEMRTTYMEDMNHTPLTNSTRPPPDLPHEEFHEEQEPPIQN